MTGQLISKIPELLEDRRMNAHQLHMITRISYPTSLLISKGHIPSNNAAKILAKLCEAFDCQLNDLFIYEEV
jgi:DNA-binding Xre family transcriptional regulator